MTVQLRERFKGNANIFHSKWSQWSESLKNGVWKNGTVTMLRARSHQHLWQQSLRNQFISLHQCIGHVDPCCWATAFCLDSARLWGIGDPEFKMEAAVTHHPIWHQLAPSKNKEVMVCSQSYYTCRQWEVFPQITRVKVASQLVLQATLTDCHVISWLACWRVARQQQ